LLYLRTSFALSVRRTWCCGGVGSDDGSNML